MQIVLGPLVGQTWLQSQGTVIAPATTVLVAAGTNTAGLVVYDLHVLVYPDTAADLSITLAFGGGVLNVFNTQVPFKAAAAAAPVLVRIPYALQCPTGLAVNLITFGVAAFKLSYGATIRVL